MPEVILTTGQLKISFGKGNKTWKTEFKLNMTDLGEALDASSGCKNIQTTEASKEEQAQPPAPPGMGKGNSLILSQMGKRRKPHKPQIRAGLDPTRKALRKGSVSPAWAHCGATAVFGSGTGIQELLPLYPRDN